MKTVREILAKKGSSIYSLSPDDTVYEALVQMAEKNVGALLVLENGQLGQPEFLLLMIKLMLRNVCL
ncbi:MAG: CBS domain-containing protein [Ignavibacteriaceae bacterium]|nr:CBS domain-containing protein [Ignavibacteriaceae bacterium]